jgi:hypothetical protein
MITIWLYILLSFVPAFVNAQLVSYLRDLEELGYCIIPQVLSTSEAEVLYQRVWHEFIERAWPNCRLDDRSNWAETFPMHNKMGIFSGPAGQIQVMWDLRQDPRIVDIFAQIWNTKDLIVSMDGLSLMCPPEIRESYIEPWPHVDQRIMLRQDHEKLKTPLFVDFASETVLRTQPYMIQGQFLFEDSFDGDGGLYCIPKSHLRFNEFAPQLEEIFNRPEVSQKEKWKAHNDYLTAFFSTAVDESNNPYQRKQITAPRGSLILWDSRTVHWGQWPCKGRPYKENPKMRMVGYLSYVPKTRLTEEERALRKKAFETGITAVGNSLKYTRDYMDHEFERYLEDESYRQPKIDLSPLGHSLLGLEP